MLRNQNFKEHPPIKTFYHHGKQREPHEWHDVPMLTRFKPVHRITLAATMSMAILWATLAHPLANAAPTVVPILLVATGEDAQIEPIAGTNTYRLRMMGTQDLITWFTDRPARKTGVMLAHELTAQWRRIGFGQVPPNSALVLRDGMSTHTVSVVATQPKYANGVLAFTIRPLEKTSALPVSAKSASLFIDDAAVDTSATPWNFHSVIPATSDNNYIAKFQLKPNSASNVLIYSMPASALINGFTNAHITQLPNSISPR